MNANPLLKFASVLCVATPFLHAKEDPQMITPVEPIRLLEMPREEFRFHLDPATAEVPEETAEDVFKLENGHLTVSGRTWGYIRTAKRYRDYRVTLEYRFTGPTSGTRAEKARDSGLLLHCFGTDGSYKKQWMPCLEAQIMEGATGDFIALGPYDEVDNLVPVWLETTVVRKGNVAVPWFDPDGEKIGIPTGIPLGNAVSSSARSVDWKSVKGIHFPTDADYPTGEKWNMLDVTCKGDEIIVRVNDKLVNHGRNVSPTLGYLGIQSEGAEIEYREWVLHPLADEAN